MATKLPTCPTCGPRCVLVLHGKLFCGKCKRRLHARPMFIVHGYGWT